MQNSIDKLPIYVGPLKMRNAAEKSKEHTKVLQGVMLMIIHAFCMSLITITSKQLIMQGLHPKQVAFLYKATVLVAIIPWCFFGGLKKNLHTKKLGLHITRGALSTFATLCYLSALKQINALDATALTYLEPIFMMVIGVMYFKETFTNIKFILAVFSFIGAMFIVKPSFLTEGSLPDLNMGYIYILMALGFWAMNNISIKLLGKTEHTKTQLFYMLLISSAVSLPLALEGWTTLEVGHIKYLVILAVCHLLHSVSFFKALKYGEISAIMPFDYTRLLFTGIMSYIFLHENLNRYSIVGYLMMVCSGVIFIRYEAIMYKKKSKSAKEEKLKELGAEYEQI